ncbi:major capsid protein [Nocardia sp. SC052]|uniref:major capsid protein n=1 Tax=Nocardia sichangensis TaxID=3385975 RepID=UPI0039A21287
MDPFEMPEDLTGLTRDELSALLAQAEAEFDRVSAAPRPDGQIISQADVERLRELTTAANTLTGQINTVDAENAARAAEARELIEARAARAAVPEPTPEPVVELTPELAAAPVTPEGTAPDNGGTGGTDGGAADVVTAAEQITEQAATAAPAVTASTTPPAPAPAAPSFRGLGARTGRALATQAPSPAEVGFIMRPNAHKYVGGHVGFRELAASINAMTTGQRIYGNRDPLRFDGGASLGKIPLSLATLDRGFSDADIINAESEEEYRDALTSLVERTDWRASAFDDEGALTAAGGWCAVPETIYTFCDVNPATGLLTLPSANFGPRGGQRRPVEPDFRELYATLPWRYTATELEAVDGSGNPVVTKPCVEIPCTTWQEIEVEAIGLCVTAGILQKRGHPELVQRFLEEVVKAHLIKISLWSIMDMADVSTAYTITGGAVGAAGAMLNGFALRSTLIRQQERVDRTALIEGVAPAWALEVAKADMALQQGREVKAVTDQEIDSWLLSRNIRMQWVQHWQELPVNSIRWPNSVDALLYPAGAFVQHLQPVIEVGTLYDKAMLQQNRYMEIFTEDEYAIDKRCRISEKVTVPLCANGSIGAREQITCPTTVNEVQTPTISGSPTGGTFTLTFKGQTTAPLAYNATAAQVQAALAALSTIGAGNVAVTGSAGGPYTVTFQALLGATNVPAMTATGSFTGGSSPSIAVTQTTAGAPNTLT